MTNKINQKFVEIVRSTGGNNTYRITESATVPEESLKKLYTWEGSWTRTSGAKDGGYELKSCDAGLNVQSLLSGSYG